jgi:hypothetical protein
VNENQVAGVNAGDFFLFNGQKLKTADRVSHGFFQRQGLLHEIALEHFKLAGL